MIPDIRFRLSDRLSTKPIGVYLLDMAERTIIIDQARPWNHEDLDSIYSSREMLESFSLALWFMTLDEAISVMSRKKIDAPRLVYNNGLVVYASQFDVGRQDT